MNPNNKVGKVTFPGELFLNIGDPQLPYERAHEAAVSLARKYGDDPLLLSWFNKKSGEESPNTSCEGGSSEPGWVNYAKGHGANLTVNVNHGDYVFMFRSGVEFPQKSR